MRGQGRVEDGGGDLPATPLQAQQRHPGQRVPAQLVGTPVRRLRGIEVAPEPVQLTDAVVRLSRDRDVQGLQVCRRLPRLRLSTNPLPVHDPQLGTVDPADPGEHHRRGMPREPAFGQRGPTLRPGKVQELEAKRHRVAVKRPHPLGCDLPCLHRQHRLVDVTQPLGSPPLVDSHAPAEEAGQRHHRRQTVPLARRERLTGQLARGVEVPCHQRLLGIGRQQESPLRRIRLLLQKPTGPGHPPDADVLTAPHDLGVSQLERHQRGLHRSAKP